MTDEEQHTDPESWPTGLVSPRELKAQVDRGEISTVRLAVPDMQGRPKGKILSAPVFMGRMESAAEVCAYVLATDINMTPLHGFELTGWEQGYGDLKVKADPAAIRLLPNQPGTALVMGDAFHHDDTPVDVAPRYILRTQLERLADLGYHVALGTEVEFLLHQGTAEDVHEAGYRGLRPAWPHNLDYALSHPPQATDFFHHLHDTLKEAGIPVEAIKTEGASGQVEATFVYGEVMAACDAYTASRLITYDLAQRRGMTPNFMAAPTIGVGNGLHLHLSLWSAHGNAFTYHRSDDLPPVMERAIAGLLSAMPHLAPLYAPTVNSYKRYTPTPSPPPATPGASTTAAAPSASPASARTHTWKSDCPAPTPISIWPSPPPAPPSSTASKTTPTFPRRALATRTRSTTPPRYLPASPKPYKTSMATRSRSMRLGRTSWATTSVRPRRRSLGIVPRSRISSGSVGSAGPDAGTAKVHPGAWPSRTPLKQRRGRTRLLVLPTPLPRRTATCPLAAEEIRVLNPASPVLNLTHPERSPSMTPLSQTLLQPMEPTPHAALAAQLGIAF